MIDERLQLAAREERWVDRFIDEARVGILQEPEEARVDKRGSPVLVFHSEPTIWLNALRQVGREEICHQQMIEEPYRTNPDTVFCCSAKPFLRLKKFKSGVHIFIFHLARKTDPLFKSAIEPVVIRLASRNVQKVLQ